MRIINRGQWDHALELEMDTDEAKEWLAGFMPGRWSQIFEDEGSQKVKRRFLIINGQPVIIYEIPEEVKRMQRKLKGIVIPQEHKEWEKPLEA